MSASVKHRSGKQQSGGGGLNAGRQGGFENNNNNIGAMSRDELFRCKEKTADGRSGWMYVAGKHGASTYRELGYGFVMEALVAFLIGTSVALTVFFARFSSVGIINAAVVALAYGISYYVSTRLPYDYKLRRHGSGAISIGYLFTGEIGIPGLIFYLVAQYLGSILGGIFVASLLLGRTDAFLPVPLPTTTSLVFANVVILEMIVAALVVCVHLCAEFLNSTGNTYGDHTSMSGAMTLGRRLRKNFNWATGITAFVMAWAVVLFFQFEVFTFNNVPYTTGLFAGALGVPAANQHRNMDKMAYLTDGALYPTSRWIGQLGPAWAHYMFSPLAGGLIGAAIFWLLFAIGAKADSILGNNKVPFPCDARVNAEYHEMTDDGFVNGAISHAAPASLTASATTPMLRTGLVPQPSGM